MVFGHLYFAATVPEKYKLREAGGLFVSIPCLYIWLPDVYGGHLVGCDVIGEGFGGGEWEV